MSGRKGCSGRHKTPTAILLKRGSWRGKDRAGTEPEVVMDNFKVPENLSPQVREYYNANLSDFKARGILSDTDSIAFEMLAKAFVRWKALDSALKKEDNEIANMFMKITDKDGNVSVATTDIAKEEKDRFKILQTMLIQFGFTPVTRANVHKTDVRNVKTMKIT